MEDYTSWTRRKFLKASISTGALMSATPLLTNAFGRDIKTKTLTILHTNDWHSRIDPFPANDAKYSLMGGASRRAALINQIRKEEESVLLLDAGDVFQGTPYFNFYGGELEFKLMSQMGYDAGTLGNHDFDNGVEGLMRMMPHAQFPFVNCNYDVEGTLLEKNLKKSIVLVKNGIKIGILGVGVDLEGLVAAENFKGITYNHPVERANNEARRLKKEKRCDLVICLSHLGLQYESNKVSDRVLAINSEDIDLIIGGHTHTFMEKPITVMNKNGNPVTINQVGWAGLRLGRIDYAFSSINNVQNEGLTRIELFKKPIAI